MADKKLVVKDNALINASYTLDLAEQRMILLAIVEAREKGVTIDNFTPVVVHADVYAKQFNVSKQTAYEVLKAACAKLLSRRFSFQEPRPEGIADITSNWVQRAAYIKDSGTVEIMFSYDLVPMITALEKQFTSYELEQVSGLTSAYAVRLYEMLIAWRSVGKTPVFELAQFRWQLGVELSEYQRMHHFKAKVLDFAIEQINEHTDITVTYEQHKRGRSITGFSFRFKQKAKPEPERDANTIDMLTGKTDAEAAQKQLTLTGEQAALFASKLADDGAFGSRYGKTGEDPYPFKMRIQAELRQPEKVVEYMPHLLRLGFKLNMGKK